MALEPVGTYAASTALKVGGYKVTHFRMSMGQAYEYPRIVTERIGTLNPYNGISYAGT